MIAGEPEAFTILLRQAHSLAQVAQPVGEAALVEARHPAHKQVQDDVVGQAQLVRFLQAPVQGLAGGVIFELPGVQQTGVAHGFQGMPRRPVPGQHRRGPVEPPLGFGRDSQAHLLQANHQLGGRRPDLRPRSLRQCQRAFAVLPRLIEMNLIELRQRSGADGIDLRAAVSDGGGGLFREVEIGRGVREPGKNQVELPQL